MIITRAPFRLSFFGGGTDYNSWFEEHGGLIIGCAFDKYCYITLRRLPPFFEHKTRIAYSHVEMVNDNRDIRHPSVKGCFDYFGINEGLEVHHDGDLPARSGIGSSSAFTSSMLLALNALRSRMLTKRELAQEAIHVEQNIIGENVGIQDQILTTFGGIQVIEMGPGNRFKVNPLILPVEYKSELEKSIMLGFTGFTRTASHLAKDQIDNIKTGKSTSQLSEITSIAHEAFTLFRQNRELSEIGKLFDQTWKLKRSISPDISSPEIDETYEKAMAAGAYGGRLMGAGGGGVMFFLAPPDRHEKIRAELKNHIKVWVPFRFEEDGAQVLLHRVSEFIAPIK